VVFTVEDTFDVLVDALLELVGALLVDAAFDVEDAAFDVDEAAFDVEVAAFELEVEASTLAETKISFCAPSTNPYRELYVGGSFVEAWLLPLLVS